jgi:Caspase domain
VAGGRRALLIATDTYSDRLFRELRGPGADVEALAALLADPSIGGYAVEVLHNRPAYDVAVAINGLFVEARRGDLILLYLAGHGVKDDAGHLYLAMTNSRHDRLEATTVSAQFVRDQMTRSRSEYIAVWLDCCYAGAFPPGARHRTAVQLVDVVHRLRGRGRAVMTASSALEYAYETGAEPDLMVTGSRRTGRGVFTDALIRGLGTGAADLDGDGLIDVDELYRYVYDQVDASPFQQTPRLDSQIDGTLCIATSVRGPRTTPGLPDEIVQALRNPLPKVRLAVLDDVVALGNGGSSTTLAQVRATLTDLAADQDTDVAAAARSHLQRLHAPDPTVTEPDEPTVAPIRPISQRRFKPILAALVLTATTLGSLLAADQPERTKAVAAQTVSSAPAPTTSPSPSSGPRVPATTNFTVTFGVDPIPAYQIGNSRINGSTQMIEIHEVTGNSQAGTQVGLFRVYQAGAFDPREAQTGEAITVAGRAAFYHPRLTLPTIENQPDGGTYHSPSVAAQYAPDSWYLVTIGEQVPKARDTALQVAAAVRFGVKRPMRFPVRFDYLPARLRPCGGWDGLDPPGITPEPWNGEIKLCDDLYGRSGQLAYPAGEAITILMDASPDWLPPSKSNRIGGRPAKISDQRGPFGPDALVDCGEFVMQITVAVSHASRYGPAELEKIIEFLTVRSLKSKSTWFDGPDALPTIL